MKKEFNIFDVVKKGELRMRMNSLKPPYTLELTPELVELAQEQIESSDKMAFTAGNALFRISDTLVIQEVTLEG